jgi:DNA-binding transcriptional LysR family regulator
LAEKKRDILLSNVIIATMTRVEPLTVFISVVDSSSFTRAARDLGLTPSAISKQIRQLEERLGTRLLHRTTRSVIPTEAGKLYYERGRQIMEALDETEIRIRALDATPQGRLRVLAEPFFGRLALAQIMHLFRQRYREVSVDLTLAEGITGAPRDAFDVSIHLERPDGERLVSKELSALPTILCASTDYLTQHGRPQSLADLAEHDFIEVTTHGRIEPPRWSSRRSLTVNDLDLAFYAMREGMGIGVFPLYVVQRDLERQRVQRLLPDEKLVDQAVWVSYPAIRQQSPKTRAFVDFLTETLSTPVAAVES